MYATAREPSNLQAMIHRIIALCAGLIFLHAASAQDALSGETATTSVKQNQAGDVRTFIPHALVVKPFVPPVPPLRKVLPAVRVDASLTVPANNGTTLSLLRGEASTLPDIPPPLPPVSSEHREATAEEFARQVWHRRHNLAFGATVFDHRVSHVCWTDPDSGVFYQALCGFDIGLLAGIGSFVHNEEKYSFFLMHSGISIPLAGRIARSYAARFPQLPEIDPGEILIIRGDATDSDAVAPIHIMGKLIDSEKDRLILYQDARIEYFRKHAAWMAAHPEIPQDEAFLFRPHRGSRYLANPQPEGKEGLK